MSNIKKGAAVSMISLVMLISITACGRGSNTGVGITIEKPKEELQENCTLHVVTMMGSDAANSRRYSTLLKEFKKSHPNIHIEDESVLSDNDWKIQMEADFVMDNEPDVFQYFTDATAINILQTDKFVTLEEIQAEDNRIAANTSKAALEQTKSPLDGINYAVPTTGYWEGMFCNQDIFDKFGLELPKTWEDLLYVIRVLNENNIVPIAAALNDIPNYWIDALLLTAAGKEEFTAIPETAPDSWVDGLSKIMELYEAGAFPNDIAMLDNEMAGRMFRDKRAAMYLEGSWFLNKIEDQDNTVVCALPAWEGAKIEQGTAIQGYSSGFYITKKAWEDPVKRKAALEFVYANTCDEQILKYWSGNGTSSVPIPEGGKLTNLQKSSEDYIDTIMNPVSPIDSRIKPEAFNTLKNKMMGIITGKITPRDGINAMLEINNY